MVAIKDYALTSVDSQRPAVHKRAQVTPADAVFNYLATLRARHATSPSSEPLLVVVMVIAQVN